MVKKLNLLQKAAINIEGLHFGFSRMKSLMSEWQDIRIDEAEKIIKREWILNLVKKGIVKLERVQ